MTSSGRRYRILGQVNPPHVLGYVYQLWLGWRCRDLHKASHNVGFRRLGGQPIWCSLPCLCLPFEGYPHPSQRDGVRLILSANATYNELA